MKKAILVVALFLVSTACAFAQIDPEFPCEGADPDAPVIECPIDTWVVLFAGLALTATVFHLHRKTKVAAVVQRTK